MPKGEPLAEPLTANSIERLARALLSTLAPITGTRATGTVTATALVDGTLPRNAHLLPVVGGQLRDDLVFKTAEAVTLTAGAHVVDIISNVGGARQNLPAGTVLRFDPPIEGFAPTVTLDASMTGGSDTGQLLKSLAFFEDLNTADPSRDIFASKLGEYPGAMMIWSQSEPAEGAMAGLRQGSNRGGRRVKFMRESFVLYVVVGRLGGDSSRRQDGLVVLQAITRLLSDRMQNDDGEQLSSVGAGVEITGRARLSRGETHYIYGLRMRVNQVLEGFDSRTFNPWTLTTFEGALPGRDVPEPIELLTIVDDETVMP